jgi:hypothetical protein
MKRIIIFCSIILVIIATVWFNYINYKSTYNSTLKENLEFEKLYQKEIYGTYLTTIINKVINSNEKNNVEITKEKKYINNNINSINIDIKMVDTDSIYSMETLYNGGMEKFVEYYGNIQFKCTQIDYHKSTKKVKYLLFEQISQ